MGSRPGPAAAAAPRGARDEAAPEEDTFQRPPRFYSTLALLYLVCFVEGVDVQLLPSSFRALEADLGLTPMHLATLGLMQALAMALSAPVWGSLADHGWSRKWILTFGAAGWGILTLLLALVTSFRWMLVLRLLNGAMLGTLTPICQSVVADMSRPAERGFLFGLGQLGVHSGSILCSVFATSMSNHVVFGAGGWRVAFATVGVLSLGLAVMLVAGMPEPARSHAAAEGDLTLGGVMRRFRGYLRINTFKAIVLQGVFGSVPWSALSFSILFFQYCGIPDGRAALLWSMAVAGQGVGGLLGGWVADELAARSPEHGRALAAQVSVGSGIPLIAAVLLLVPPEPASFWLYFVLMTVFGLLASWCAGGVNKPIMTEIVDARNRASVIAWLTALEGSSAACLGAPVVGMLAEFAFGYQPTQMHVSEMSPVLRDSNASALSEAMLWCTLGPWSLCLVCYTLLHFTYGPDVAKVHGGPAPGAAREWTSLLQGPSDAEKVARQSETL